MPMGSCSTNHNLTRHITIIVHLKLVWQSVWRICQDKHFPCQTPRTDYSKCFNFTPSCCASAERVMVPVWGPYSAENRYWHRWPHDNVWFLLTRRANSMILGSNNTSVVLCCELGVWWCAYLAHLWAGRIFWIWEAFWALKLVFDWLLCGCVGLLSSKKLGIRLEWQGRDCNWAIWHDSWFFD